MVSWSLRTITLSCALLAVLIQHPTLHSAAFIALWSCAQWMPLAVGQIIQETVWKHWNATWPAHPIQEEIPIVNVGEHRNHLLSYLETTYGKDWRKRPVLLKGLWSQEDLQSNDRTVSLQGLLQLNLTIPFFTDARKGALAPDGWAPLGEVVTNISHGAPHKIGTQLLLQKYPHLIKEVAPHDIVTQLFGDFFRPDNLVGSGPFNLLPALTTVPLFVANGNPTKKSQPYTTLHCEPIGNVAVQLSGQKRWTLIRPEFSLKVKPSTSPDGRAFFASNSDSEYYSVPTYSAITEAGDAMWVPTWTWHRVDYIPSSSSNNIAIGASLFHFRPLDFVSNNPLFALLIIPALVLELVGYSTQ